MSDDLKHTKIKTFEEDEQGDLSITSRSYHERLSYIKEERASHIDTHTGRIMADVVGCLDVLKGRKVHELHIIIETDKHGLPRHIEKIYTTRRENFNRR